MSDGTNAITAASTADPTRAAGASPTGALQAPQTAKTPAKPGAAATGDSLTLSPQAKALVAKLQARDADVRAHEEAHVAAGGSLVTGGPNYVYEKGPDGRNYAVGGDVTIDSSPVRGDPKATEAKELQVEAAALAPADPSGQDLSVAASAAAAAAQAGSQAAAQAVQGTQGKPGTAKPGGAQGATGAPGTQGAAKPAGTATGTQAAAAGTINQTGATATTPGNSRAGAPATNRAANVEQAATNGHAAYNGHGLAAAQTARAAQVFSQAYGATGIQARRPGSLVDTVG